MVVIVALAAMAVGFAIIVLMGRSSPPAHRYRENTALASPEALPFAEADQARFEGLCAALLRKLDLEIQEIRRVAENEVEFLAVRRAPVIGGQYLVSCLFLGVSDLVDTEKVWSLSSAVRAERALKGILITTGYFTKDVHNLLEGAPVELINRDRLAELLRKHEIS